jgi:hypothetical protein
MAAAIPLAAAACKARVAGFVPSDGTANSVAGMTALNETRELAREAIVAIGLSKHGGPKFGSIHRVVIEQQLSVFVRKLVRVAVNCQKVRLDRESTAFELL